MSGSHIAGTGGGAIFGVILAALAPRVGVHLDDATSASLGLACAAVGLAIGHAFSKAWKDPGILPALRRGFLGVRKS